MSISPSSRRSQINQPIINDEVVSATVAVTEEEEITIAFDDAQTFNIQSLHNYF